MVNRLNIQDFVTVRLKDKILTALFLVCLVGGVLRGPLIAFSDGLGLSGGPITKEAIVRLTNEIRGTNGLQELNQNRLLDSAAFGHRTQIAWHGKGPSSSSPMPASETRILTL
jgi:hypothetical protein